MPPLGWFLAQGMIPLGPDSSDDDEGPCELPDGRLVCGPHGLTVCGKCCVDYNFGNDVGADYHYTAGFAEVESEEDAVHPPSTGPPPASASHRQQARATPHAVAPDISAPGLEDILNPDPLVEHPKGTGRVFPSKFTPPSSAVTPQELFSGRRKIMLVTRYVLPHDARTGLIFADGACLDNGQANPRAGWAFWHGTGAAGQQLVASGRLEKKGPYGDEGAQTSNRAELRAVIAALRFRYWPGERFNRLVIATDSEYVVEGATNWSRNWIRENWTRRAGPRSRQRTEVKNKDLWQALLGQIEKFKTGGMDVEFWRIPREWNTVADAAAKQAAAESDEGYDEFQDLMGINV
ncbi:RNase H domain protein [Rhypophila decipiens]|uniref:ribonuclease H n=1 Tax=Rhypophila decipiens TaxID=261697 RepID=A0AAN6XXU7_9PEZI|nr:RNase H domain protein [Rhypophila decipiens]